MKDIIIIKSEHDREAIEAAIQSLKCAAWKDIVKCIPLVEEHLVEGHYISKSVKSDAPILIALASTLDISSSDYFGKVLHNSDIDEQLMKSVEEISKIFSCRESNIIAWIKKGSLSNDAVWYAKFFKEGRAKNHWWDKSKFKKKGRIKSWF